MNPDVQHNKCSAIEQKMNIPEGILKKEVKSKEQKTKDIEEEIKRKQEQLEKMNKSRTVTTSRQVAEMERKKREEEERQQREEEERRQKEVERRKREEKRRREEAERERGRKEREKNARLEKARKEREKAERERKAREAAVAAKKRAMSPPAPKSKTTVNNSSGSSKAINSPTVSQSMLKKARVTLTNIRPSQKSEEVNSVEKRRPSVASDSDEPASPAKRSKAMSSVDSDSDTVNSNKYKSVTTQSDDTEDEAPPVKRGRRSAFNNSIADTSSCEEEMKDNDVQTRLSSTDADSDSDIGTKVEVQVSKKWYTGRVIKVNHADNKWKVKFDNNPRDKYDKWFDKGSTDIKLVNGHPPPASTNHVGSSPASSSHEAAAEAPSSSTATTAVATSSDQVTEEIANGYRTCLRYFLPPQWVMDKETITTMTLQELANFPLDDFFDHYEKGLRKLVGNFQTEAAQKKQESEAAVSKLSSVRKLIAKLLKSINEEFDIDPEADGDQVDELLAACVKQAVQSQT